MAATIDSLDTLKTWDTYKTFLKDRWKQLPAGETEFYVSKKKVDFDQGGKSWKGYAVLAGKKGKEAVKALKKEGQQFHEGTCTLTGKEFAVDGIAPDFLKQATRTLKMLKLGYKISGQAEEEGNEADVAEVTRRLTALAAGLKSNATLVQDALTAAFLKQATKAAKDAKAALANDPDTALELVEAGEELLKQVQLNLLEGGDDSEATVIGKRQQALLADLKEAKALGDARNDTELDHGNSKAEKALAALGKKDYEGATALLDEVEDHLAEMEEGEEPAADADPDLAGLTDWKSYRDFMKVQLKKLGSEDGPIFISRKKYDFDMDGKPFSGFAVLVGKKARITVNILKKEGTLFKEGIVKADGKKLLVSAMTAELIKGAKKTFQKLRLGRKIVPHGELPTEDSETAEAAKEDLSWFKGLDREIKAIAKNLITLREGIESQKKLSVTQLKSAVDAKTELEKIRTKYFAKEAEGGTPDELAAINEEFKKQNKDTTNQQIESKEFALLTKRWGEDLRDYTERLNRIKNSEGSESGKRAELKKLKDDVTGKLLDTKIANLDPNDPKTGKLIAKQIEARFGAKFKLFKSTITGNDADGKPITEDYKTKQQAKKEADALKQLYLTMSKCPNFPKSHLVGLEVSLRPAESRGEGGVYYPGAKKAGINCKRPKDSFKYDVSNPKHFPDGVDPDCQPANTDPVKYFNWATLHEVAHAVDAKHGFMDKNGGKPAYGNWVQYNGSNGPIAKAVAAKHGVGLGADDLKALEAYALAKINGGAVAAPRSPEEGAKRGAVDTWRVAVGVDKSLWWNGAGCKANEIDGVVYQEAYGGRWVSYDLAARSKGIHGYQFRAPGEWFAELYAAYYSDKLKPSHPIIHDLAKLGTPA